jgi:hypothetical protein
MIVKALAIVNESPSEIGCCSLIDRMEIRQEGRDAHRDEVLMRTHTHAASNEDLAVCKRCGHESVLVIVRSLMPVVTTEGVVSRFGSSLALPALTVDNRENFIVMCTPEVCTDRLTVVCDECDLLF